MPQADAAVAAAVDSEAAMAAHSAASVSRAAPHTILEDAQAIVTGTLIAALGITMLADARLMTGGVVGLSFLLHYASGWSVGALLAAVNLPFYLLAWHKKGWRFAAKTFGAVLLLSLFTELLPLAFRFSHIEPLYAAVMGGLLAGIGILVLFRHGASLGGFNILALYLQDRLGWRAGMTLLVLDGTILLASFTVLPVVLVATSLAGAAIMNTVLAVNHRPERYSA